MKLGYSCETYTNVLKSRQNKIQLVTISRPSAYGEYEPYRFVESEVEFAYAVEHM